MKRYNSDDTVILDGRQMNAILDALDNNKNIGDVVKLLDNKLYIRNIVQLNKYVDILEAENQMLKNCIQQQQRNLRWLSAN